MSGLSSHGAVAAGSAAAPIVNAPNAAAAARILKLGVVILFPRSGTVVYRTNSELNIRANLSSMQVGTLSQQPGTVCDFPCVPARLSVICGLETIWQENISRGDSDEPRHENRSV